MCLDDKVKPTERELQVMTLIAQGFTSKEISRDLGIALRTVEAHLGTAYQKLGASRRTDAIAKAIKVGWIKLE